MTDDPESKRLNDLAARIRLAGSGPKTPQPERASREEEASAKASRPAIDFAATIVVCALIGWFADHEFGLAPWGVVSMIFIGFAAGMVNIWRVMQKIDNEDRKMK